MEAEALFPEINLFKSTVKIPEIRLCSPVKALWRSKSKRRRIKQRAKRLQNAADAAKMKVAPPSSTQPQQSRDVHGSSMFPYSGEGDDTKAGSSVESPSMVPPPPVPPSGSGWYAVKGCEPVSFCSVCSLSASRFQAIEVTSTIKKKRKVSDFYLPVVGSHQYDLRSRALR